MNKLNKKQKIIIIMIAVIIIVGYFYYTYTRDKDFFTEEEFETLDSQNVDDDSVKKEENDKIKIHILGAIENPGILELEEGSRIADAIEMAGGCKENACISEINLAYVVEDGMKIRIPTNEEVENKKDNNTDEEIGYVSFEGGSEYIDCGNADTYSNNLNSSNANGKNSNTQSSSIKSKNSEGTKKDLSKNKININSANQTELEELPGIGEGIAKKIISYRNENGKFKEINDIKNVKGIGESKFKAIKDFIII